ncbi:MAG: hypothetical protein ACO1TE_02945 [Prosthecobacter sp.]
MRRPPAFTVVLLLVCGLATASVSAAEPVPASEFTTTDPKKVKVLKGGTEVDPGDFKHLCPGLGGYQVIHEGGDDRSWLNLMYRGQTTDLMADTLKASSGTFPTKANDIVQWRGFRQGKGFVPYAIIFRMTAGNPDEKSAPFETLLILKLDGAKSRVVGHLSAKEGNAKAEALADQLCRP